MRDHFGNAADQSATGAERRIGARLLTAQLVAITTPSGEISAKLLDMSNTGARLLLSQGIVPDTNQKIRITLLNNVTVDGSVCWLGHNELGIQFDHKLEDAGEFLHYDELGYEYFTRALALQRRVRHA